MANEEILQLKSYDEITGRVISNVLPITNSEAVKVESDKNLKDKLTEINEKIEQTNSKVDIHIENHSQYNEGVMIDDTIISKEKTWSSSKIEDFVHINDSVVLSTVQGEALSLDYTKEGYLKEFEICGNTIQNANDLSNIQHLGELYVDDAGQLILDNEGKKQYKVEVKVNNGVLWEGNFQFRVTPNWETSNLIDNGNYGASDYIDVEDISMLNQTTTCYCFFFDKYKQPITHKQGFDIVVPQNAKYVRVVAYAKHCQQNACLRIQGVKYTIKKEYKVTLLLPCQLTKVGNTSDRLCWDDKQHKYIVKKNTLQFVATNVTRGIKDKNDYIQLYRVNGIQAKDHKIIIDSNIYTGNRDSDWVNLQVDSEFYYNNGYSLTDNDARRFLKDYPVNIICATSYVNEVIDTNITEQILLPCYKDKTRFCVIGGIDGGIKIKVPIDSDKAIQDLSIKNTALNIENEEIKNINKIQDELINTTMLAIDTMYCLLESSLINALKDDTIVNPLLDIYVAMVQRGIKRKDEVPVQYREQVIKILEL